jgi:hypothetical protein
MRTVVRAEAVDPDGAPRELLYAWNVLTGPASGVEFARPNEPESEVTFSKPGTYRLRLIVTDGHAYSRGDVDVVAGTFPPPVARPDSYEIQAGLPLELAAPGVLANDGSGTGDPVDMKAFLVDPPRHGKVVLHDSGELLYYVPAGGFTGTERLTYRARDGRGMLSAVTPVTLTVKPGVAKAAVAFPAPAAGQPPLAPRLWLRSDRGIELDGDTVTAWRDQSGNGYDALAVSQSSRPRLVADAAHGGLPAIRFDGMDDQLKADNGLDMTMPGPFTVAVVVTPRAAWPDGLLGLVPAGEGGCWDTDDAFAVGYSRRDGDLLIKCSQGYYSLGFRTGTDVTRDRPVSLVFTRPFEQPDKARTWSDGKVVDEVTDLSFDAIPATQKRGYHLGSGVPPRDDLFGDQDLYEILVYDRVLSDKEIEALNLYLKGRQREP